MNKKKYFVVMLGIFIYIFILLGQNRVPVEELESVAGIGYDIEKKSADIIEYSIPLSTNVYNPNGRIETLTFKEQGQNLGEIIQKRQEKMNKKFIQGQERVVLVSEDYARYGVRTIMDDRFRNSEANDMAYMVVCKGKSEDYLKYKVKGYINSSEYINGLIGASPNFNFFSDNYKLIDAYVRIGAEGRNLILPYIEITEEGIQIMGMAVFKKDKMVTVVNMQNTRILNLLRENNVIGELTLQENSKTSIDYEGKTSKRKVKCYKKGDKYSFNIDLTLTGSIISNEMYRDILTDINKKKQFEKDMTNSLENQCKDFIKIMQNEYRIDCIGLGKEAVAKFGREKNIDWNEVVCNSEINVTIKVKVDSQGRGDY